MEYLLAFIVLVGALIWFHELGHFLMAKLFGVKVEVFSVGFGPVLISKRVGETEYRISAVPLGGFVKLYGEEENIQDSRAFSSKPNWQKILIAFGGPLFNMILAMLLFTLLSAFNREMPKHLLEKPVVGHVVENSFAHKIGIKEGDLIVEINSRRVESWKDIERNMFQNILNKNWEVKVLREGKEIRLFAQEGIGRVGSFGAEPSLPPAVGNVIKDSPAYQVGLRRGDRVLSVNGVEVKSWHELVKAIRASGDRPITIVLKRGSQVEEKTLVPKIDPQTRIPVIGVTPYVETVVVDKGILQVLVEGVEKTYFLGVLSLKAVWGLITGSISVKNLGGPIAIAQLAGESAQQGILPFIGMMALISIQLAIFNLIPLPVLDGGLILLFLIESILRRPLSPKFKEVWIKAGYAIVIALAGFAIINDILRILGGGKF